MQAHCPSECTYSRHPYVSSLQGYENLPLVIRTMLNRPYDLDMKQVVKPCAAVSAQTHSGTHVQVCGYTQVS